MELQGAGSDDHYLLHVEFSVGNVLCVLGAADAAVPWSQMGELCIRDVRPSPPLPSSHPQLYTLFINTSSQRPRPLHAALRRWYRRSPPPLRRLPQHRHLPQSLPQSRPQQSPHPPRAQRRSHQRLESLPLPLLPLRLCLHVCILLDSKLPLQSAAFVQLDDVDCAGELHSGYDYWVLGWYGVQPVGDV